MAKNDKEKKPFSWWKLLRTVAIVGGGIFVASSLLNFVGLSLAIPTVAATAIANVGFIAVLAGTGVMGLSAAASLVTGVVNLFRVIFSKKYRAQLKARRLARKQENALAKEQKKNKNKTKGNEKVEEKIEERVGEISKNTNPVEEPVEEEVEEIVKNPKEKETSNDDIYKGIASKNIFTVDYSAREYIALQQVYNEKKKLIAKDIKRLESLEKPTEGEKLALQYSQEDLKRVTVLERRAYNAAKKKAAAEAADMNNSISPTEREIFVEFVQKGRKSTKAKSLVNEDDHKNAEQVMQNLKEAADKKTTSTKKSGR